MGKCLGPRLGWSVLGTTAALAVSQVAGAQAMAPANQGPPPTAPEAHPGTPAAAPSTSSQSSPPDLPQAGAGPIGDVVVTARKSTEVLQRVPAAVQVLGGPQLVDRGVTDIIRLTTQVTGVVLAPNRESVVIFSRGLGQSDGQPQTTPSVEVDLDGYNVPKLALQAALFDIADVEVLKGPQGILYGRNAIGGAVLISSKRPSFDGIHAEGRLEAGNYDLRHGFLAANLPVSDSVALRASIDYNKHSGYFTNGGNDLDNLAGRLSGVANITDKLSVFLTATLYRRDGHGFPNVTIPPAPEANGDPWYIPPVPSSGVVNGINYNDPHNHGYFHASSHSFTGELKYNFSEPLTLTYVGGYLKYNSSQVNAYANRPAGIFVNYSNMYFQENFTDYSNEVRLNYKQGPFDILIGGLQHRFDLPALLVDASYMAPPVLSGPLHASEDNYGLFGDARVRVADGLRLEGGLRQSWDRKGAVGSLFGEQVNLNGSTFPEFKNLSWKVGAEYDARRNLLVYANVQTGYLPGAYQTATSATLAALGRSRRYDAQTVTAYTAGFKTRFLDDRLQLNVEGFYYDYRNFQVNQRVELIVNGVISYQAPYANVRKSRIFGSDIDLTARLLPGGVATAGVSLLDPKIVDTGFTSLAVLQPTGVYANVSNPSLHGYTLPNAPKFTRNLGYEQTIHVGEGRVVGVVGTHHESSRWLDYTHPPVPGASQVPFWKTDLSLSYYAPHDRFNIGAFARNLENAPTYSIFQGLPIRSAGKVVGAYGSASVDAPRTYGIRVGFSY